MRENQRGAGSAGDTESTQVPFRPFGLGEPPRELWGEVTVDALGSLPEERIRVPFTAEELRVIHHIDEMRIGEFHNSHLSVNIAIPKGGALTNRERAIKALQRAAERAESYLINQQCPLLTTIISTSDDSPRQKHLDYMNMYFIRLALDPFVTPPTPEDLADPDAYAQKKIARVNALIEGKSIE